MHAASFAVIFHLLLAAVSHYTLSEARDAIAYVIQNFEGGGQVVANDAGKGVGRYGLLQAAHPQADVTRLTRKQVERIYKREYWDALAIDTYPRSVRFLIFDTAVNVGPGRCRKWLAQTQDAAELVRKRTDWHRQLLTANPALYGPYALAWRLRDEVVAFVASQPDKPIEEAENGNFLRP